MWEFAFSLESMSTSIAITNAFSLTHTDVLPAAVLLLNGSAMFNQQQAFPVLNKEV